MTIKMIEQDLIKELGDPDDPAMVPRLRASTAGEVRGRGGWDEPGASRQRFAVLLPQSWDLSHQMLERRVSRAAGSGGPVRRSSANRVPLRV